MQSSSNRKESQIHPEKSTSITETVLTSNDTSVAKEIITPESKPIFLNDTLELEPENAEVQPSNEPKEINQEISLYPINPKLFR